MLSARTARYLVEAGHRVTVISGKSLKEFNSSHGQDEDLIQNRNIDVIEIRDPETGGGGVCLYEKIVYHEKYCKWIREALLNTGVIEAVRGCDVIYSLAAPFSSNALGRALSRRYAKPWVAHFSDPTMLSLGRKFRSPIRTFITNYDEANILKRADAVTFVNGRTLSATIRRLGHLRQKCHVVPHCYDPAYFDSSERRAAKNEPLRIVHVGSLYGRRTALDLVNAVQRVLQDNRLVSELNRTIAVELYGAITSEIRQTMSGIRGVEIRYMGTVSYRDSINVMKNADILALIDMPGENNLFTPSKIVDYLASGSPIIGVSPHASESSDILNKYGWPCLENGDVESISRSIKGIARAVIKGRESNSNFIKEFSAPVVVAGLAEILSGVILSGRE